MPKALEDFESPCATMCRAFWSLTKSVNDRLAPDIIGDEDVLMAAAPARRWRIQSACWNRYEDCRARRYRCRGRFRRSAGRRRRLAPLRNVQRDLRCCGTAAMDEVCHPDTIGGRSMLHRWPAPFASSASSMNLVPMPRATPVSMIRSELACVGRGTTARAPWPCWHHVRFRAARPRACARGPSRSARISRSGRTAMGTPSASWTC